MASAFYPHIFKHLVKGDVDLDTNTVRVMLLKDTYAYDATHEFVSAISSHELVDGTGGVVGYSRKDVPVTLSVDINANVDNVSDADAGVFINFGMESSATWSSASFTVRHAVAFVVGAGDNSTHKLLYYFDLVNNQVVSSGTFALLNPTPQPKIQRAAS
jgi:hypothetical protein